MENGFQPDLANYNPKILGGVVSVATPFRTFLFKGKTLTPPHFTVGKNPEFYTIPTFLFGCY